MHYELQANKEAVPSQIQVTTASRFPAAKLKAEMPKVTEAKNERGKLTVCNL